MALINAEPINVNYYFGTLEQPLALVLVLTLFIGAVLGLFSSLFVILLSRREVAKLRRHLKSTEQEVMNLRALPITDKH